MNRITIRIDDPLNYQLTKYKSSKCEVEYDITKLKKPRKTKQEVSNQPGQPIPKATQYFYQ